MHVYVYIGVLAVTALSTKILFLADTLADKVYTQTRS